VVEETICFLVGFEVYTAVVLKSIFFWDMTPCSALSGTRRFGGTSGTTQGTTRRHIPEEDTLQYVFWFYESRIGDISLNCNHCLSMRQLFFD
jgi:hypothetical protein